jgi:Tol biopolymer transport system component
MHAKEMVLVGSLILGWAARNASAQTAAQLISTRSPAVALPASANGDSLNPIVTPDGRFVVFDSTANNLLSGVETGFARQIYLRDRVSNTTILVSANTNGIGGNADSTSYGISSDGRYVVFESDATDLVAGDNNRSRDVFERDTVLGTTALVSVSSSGIEGDGRSTSPAMTPDGRYVAFISSANNLVANDTNGVADIFLRDLVGHTTSLVTVGPAYFSYNMQSEYNFYLSPPVITPDGRFVAFSTGYLGLVPNIPYPGGDVYVRDMVANQTIWASTNAASITQGIFGGSQYQASLHPAISADGTQVAFRTGLNSNNVVFLYNIPSSTTTIIWTNGANATSLAFGDDVYGPDITPDGRFVLFLASETNLTNLSVRLWDAETGTNLLVSANTNGLFSPGSAAFGASVTPDGHYVTFLSDATDLTTNLVYQAPPTNAGSAGFHIFRRDMVAGDITMIDADANGFGETNFLGTDVVLSTNGQLVFFSGPDGGLVPGDNNGAEDVFLWDASRAEPELLSQRSPSVPMRSDRGASWGGPESVSGDGRWVAFTSTASDIVSGDTNNVEDVFVCDRWSGTNILVSVGLNGGPALGGASMLPVISTNGQFVSFISFATNLTADTLVRPGAFANVFRRDLQAQTTVLVSINTNGTSAGNGTSINSQAKLAMSPDGRYVAFYSQAANLVTSARNGGFFCRDIDAGTTVAISIHTSSAFFPTSMSTNGRFVAYSLNPGNGAWQVEVWDNNLMTNIFTNYARFAAISPDGSRLLYQIGTQVTVRDLSHGSNMLTVSSTEMNHGPQVWSGDGRYVVIGTSIAYSGVDLNNKYDVYLFDLLAGTNTLVSIDSTHTASGNALSDWPVISLNGRFVVFRSFATNLVAGHNSAPDMYVFDATTGSNSVLATHQAGADPIIWPNQPAISMDGSTAIFQTTASGFGIGDLNNGQNVFAAVLPSAASTDSDGDGIPDWWTIQYFGHVTGQAFDQSLGQNDPNGTGMTVLQDYVAGTNPTDPTSIFQLQSPPPASSGGGLTLNWMAAPGRTYSVQFKNSLDDPSWQTFAGTPVINGNQGQLAVPTDQSARYFRIVVQ